MLHYRPQKVKSFIKRSLGAQRPQAVRLLTLPVGRGDVALAHGATVLLVVWILLAVLLVNVEQALLIPGGLVWLRP
jgi:hypothetical protein